MIFVNYIIAATTQVFIYSMAGGYLEEACINVGVSAYNVTWYKLDTTTRKLLVILLLRSQKPFLIEAPLVTASMPTFMSVSIISDMF